MKNLPVPSAPPPVRASSPQLGASAVKPGAPLFATADQIPHGGPTDPLGALDHLAATHLINRAEYAAGLLYAAIDRNPDPRSRALRSSCIQALERIEIDLPALLHAVCLRHRMPVTEDGRKRLRAGLAYLATHLDALESGLIDATAAQVR